MVLNDLDEAVSKVSESHLIVEKIDDIAKGFDRIIFSDL